MKRKRILILGAAGRDFHNFNVHYRDHHYYKVVGFTATQIPNIAGRRYPPELAGPLYPKGIPIFDENELETVIKRYKVNECVFSYSDVSHEYVMHLASRCLAAGASFLLLGPEETMLKSRKKIIAVCAVRTGAGKSPLTRRITAILKERGIRFVVIRHPMPYGDLRAQAVERFATLSDLDKYSCTIEEREEYEPHIRNGVIVYAGIDYEKVLKKAEKEADVIIWDGGNNDLPFIKPDLHFVVADALRPGHEVLYHPGETNFRIANVIVINKATGNRSGVKMIKENAYKLNPNAKIVETDTIITPEYESRIDLLGKRVLVIEDGPTVTHGEMGYGAAYLFAKSKGARLIDPRNFAVGSIANAYKRYNHIKEVLPALGYGEHQIVELQNTINKSNAAYIISGTPIDISRVIKTDIPIIHIRYEIKERGNVIEKMLDDLLSGSR